MKQIKSKSLNDLREELEQKRLEEYPELDCIEGYWLPDSFTNRVSYDNFNTFRLYVYPNVKKATSYYEFTVENLNDLHSNWIPHLMEKVWFNKDIYFDLIALAKVVVKDK